MLFDQNCEPGKITLQISVPMIKYLVDVSLELQMVRVTCAIFLALIGV